jgi:hypothetical protein
MNKQEQRIAIAQACGFNITHIDRDEDGEIKFIWCNKYPDDWKGENTRPWIPYFTSDLNAMHEAEKVLVGGDPLRYGVMLFSLLEAKYQRPFTAINATAAQRAEAFLKTLNLWGDEPIFPSRADGHSYSE